MNGFQPRLFALLCAALVFFPFLPARADDAPAPPSLPAVAATVNGEVIPTKEWLTRLQAVGYNDFNQSLRTRRLNAGQLALVQLVNERLILQYASKVGLLPPEAEVSKEVEAQKAVPATKERLDSHQLTEAQLRYAVRYQKTLQAFLTINQNVSPEEVRAFYDANYGRKWQVGMIRTSKRETAQRALAALEKGEAFSAVAARLSEDAATKATGGELRGADGKPRWFSLRDGGLPQQVLTAVDALKNPGDHTPIIEGQANDGSGAAFFLFELLGRFKPNDEDFLKMRPQAEREALFAKALRSGAAEKKLAEARKEAKITISLPGYQLAPQ
jgi:parvulin-like peptidyl-prolyl isomerase